jgi:hypothetical protein
VDAFAAPLPGGQAPVEAGARTTYHLFTTILISPASKRIARVDNRRNTSGSRRGSQFRGTTMRKISVFNSVSLDGYFTDSNNDYSWAHIRADGGVVAYAEGREGHA